MRQFVPIFNQREASGHSIEITPRSTACSVMYNSAVYNVAYNQNEQQKYRDPATIAKLLNKESLSQKPEYVTNALDISIKDKGSLSFSLPKEFLQCEEFVQSVADFERANSSPELYSLKSAHLLLHYYDGYDSELPSSFHWDPDKPVTGALYNVFFASTTIGTEYALTPNPDKADIKSTEAGDIVLLNGANHRRPYLPEDVERVAVSIMTTVSPQDLNHLDL